MARKLALAAPLLLLLLTAPALQAAAAENTQQVLQQLDNSAKKFRSASADFVFKNIQTVPVPDIDQMNGTVYYERQGNELRVGAHVAQRNGQPYEAVYTYNGGVFQLYQKNVNQVTTYHNAGNVSGYVMLGFGASGKELSDKFEVSYLGQETIDGVKTDKLELIPKEQKTRNLFPKITIWIDPTRDVNLKQVFDEGQGMSRVATYSNIRLNQPISASEFKFKTNKKTRFVNQ